MSGTRRSRKKAKASEVADRSTDDTSGIDIDGKVINSIDELWCGDVTESWYSRSASYWLTQTADDDGVLGGFGSLSTIDVRASLDFIRSLADVRYERAIDCGSGIGRIAVQLLAPICAAVDLVEQNEDYVNKAREDHKHNTKLCQYYISGLQTFIPVNNHYNIIWIQWVLNYLTDQDIIHFLIRCIAALKKKDNTNNNTNNTNTDTDNNNNNNNADNNSPTTTINTEYDGYIFIKENIVRRHGFILDTSDTSVTRSDQHFRDLFERAGLFVVTQKKQIGFPKELFPVMMYALKPKML